MVFVLDNYDSFTYNLVQYLGELGAEVEVRRNDELTVEQVEVLRPERGIICANQYYKRRFAWRRKNFPKLRGLFRTVFWGSWA